MGDRQKVKIDLPQLPPIDGVHSPHGQTNFLPPKTKIRVIWLENKLSILRGSDLQHV